MTITNGKPIWFELATPDPQSAATFYASVFDWTMRGSEMAEHAGYTIAAALDGDEVAGLALPPPGASEATGWSIYFGVTDIAATLSSAVQLGGRTMVGPLDIPHVGRFAVMLDPQGVALSILQPDGDDPAQPFKQTPDAIGHAVWIELAAPDPDAAFAFYGKLFGWTKEGAMPMGALGEYAFIAAGESKPGAIMSSTLAQAPSRWNSYFLVADIDAAIAKAEKEGGKLIQGPDQIPGGDYSANIVDHQGHPIGLVGPRRASA